MLGGFCKLESLGIIGASCFKVRCSFCQTSNGVKALKELEALAPTIEYHLLDLIACLLFLFLLFFSLISHLSCLFRIALLHFQAGCRKRTKSGL